MAVALALGCPTVQLIDLSISYLLRQQWRLGQHLGL